MPTGRPPKESTKTGITEMRFNAFPELRDAIRAAAEKDHREVGEWIRLALCDRLGINPPPPKKRGPKAS